MLLAAFLIFSATDCGKGKGESTQSKQQGIVFIDEPFETLYKVFDPSVEMDERDRRNIWSAYYRKTVTWTGTLHQAQRINENRVVVEFIHRRTVANITGRVKMEFPPEEAEKVFSIIPGQLVKYQGRLEGKNIEEGMVTFYLTRGKILEVEKVP